jgi:hypothetical protein
MMGPNRPAGHPAMTLHQRIAAALGWTEDQAKSFSLAALRDLVRPVNAKLAHELTQLIQSGGVIDFDAFGSEYKTR